jgi:hypothetical protein
MRRNRCSSVLLACASLLCPVMATSAHEADQAGPRTHKELTTVVARIQSGLIFLQPAAGLQNRAISLKKAERMGLENPQAGDKVTVTVDEGNVLLDIHKTGTAPAGHSLMIGKLSYADPFWEVVELSTPEGTKSFAVDSLAGSKLSVLKEGNPVRLELDEDNIVIDIHPNH